ncbi:sugar kinase [Streptomyces sp. SYSU K217416]
MTAPVLADVVALGESMVTFLPTRPGRLADVPSFERGIGGAESNVACCVAASGHTARWISRVGADAFGDHLVAAIAAYGVDTTAVHRDPRRPTGIYFRTAGERATSPPAGSADVTVARGARAVGAPGVVAGPTGGGGPATAEAVAVAGGTRGAAVRGVAAPAAGGAGPRGGLAEVAYYRAGSAASAMSSRNMPYEDLWSGRILHLSGITAALSDDCLALMRELTTRRPGRPLVSFDVNHRANLWRDAAGPRALLDLARGADIVFVGEDEAEAAWGLTNGDAIRAALPEPAVLVVKQGAQGATAYTREPLAPVGATSGAGASGEPGAEPGLGPAPLAPRGASAPGVPGAPGVSRREAGDDAVSEPLAPAGAAPAAAGPGGGGAGVPGLRAGGWGEQPRDTVTFVPGVRVDVVASVGAGDAFAAGFLSATLRGLAPRERLRHGHLMAAAALAVLGDLGIPPSRAHADRLAGLDDEAWGTLHLGPGWTAAGAGEDQVEVRTA